jgi:hypothetical protein
MKRIELCIPARTKVTQWSAEELSGPMTLNLLTRKLLAYLLIMDDPIPESYTTPSRLEHVPVNESIQSSISSQKTLLKEEFVCNLHHLRFWFQK